MDADLLGAAFREIDRARKIVKDTVNRQVRSREDRDTISAIVHTWFNSHRKRLKVDPAHLAPADEIYNTILDYTDRNTTKDAYIEAIDEAKEALRVLRGHVLLADPATPLDVAPDFSPLVGDAAMRAILERRWYECQKCLSVGADLAAVVMMGGLLEALFVARANAMKNKAPLFKCKVTPRDPKTKNPIDLRDWMLASYIDVGHELKWITKSGREVATVLRDYRNYIHPAKEHSHGIVLNSHDTAMLWDIARNLARQVLASASTP
jgi:hypothetical protein